MSGRIPIAKVKVGDRVRKDLGDLAGLMESIQKVGQLQPIVLDPDHNLIAGARRLEACRKLGHPDVKAVVAQRLGDATRALLAERDENTCRLAFTSSELVEMGRRLEAIERPKAQGRQSEGAVRGGQGSGPGTPTLEAGRTTAKVADALGVSRRTYERAKAVVDAADAPDASDEVKAARDEMDATGKVRPAYDAVAAQQRAEDAVKDDPEVVDARDLATLTGLVAQITTRVATLDGWPTERVARLAGFSDSLDSLDHAARALTDFAASVRKQQTRPLAVVRSIS